MSDDMTDHGLDPAKGALEKERRFVMQGFTARYDPMEDGIFLNAVDAKGSKQAIYVTRRLMDQMIPIVVQHLEEKTPKGIATDIVQSMTQEKSRQARQFAAKVTPVDDSLDMPRWLCSTVQIAKQPAGLTISFCSVGTAQAMIALADADLRTTLDIFLSCYRRGNWDHKIFPSWQGFQDATAEQKNQIKLN